jgi:hypothetical protein
MHTSVPGRQRTVRMPLAATSSMARASAAITASTSGAPVDPRTCSGPTARMAPLPSRSCATATGVQSATASITADGGCGCTHTSIVPPQLRPTANAVSSE